MTDLSSISTYPRRAQVAALGRLLGWYRGYLEGNHEQLGLIGIPTRDTEKVEQLYRDLVELILEKGLID